MHYPPDVQFQKNRRRFQVTLNFASKTTPNFSKRHEKIMLVSSENTECLQTQTETNQAISHPEAISSKNTCLKTGELKCKIQRKTNDMNTTETNTHLPQRHEQSKQVNDTNPSQWLPQLASIGDNKLAQSQKRRTLRTKYNEHKNSKSYYIDKWTLKHHKKTLKPTMPQ